jgi:hypothetical protein
VRRVSVFLAVNVNVGSVMLPVRRVRLTWVRIHSRMVVLLVGEE